MLSSSVLGETVSTTSPNTEWLIGLSAGPAWISGNKTQTINLEPDVVKTYTADNTNNVIPSVELFVGLQKLIAARAQSFIGQLGLSVVAADNVKLTGDIWEDADPDFNNFSYSYKINHTHIAIKGRLIGNYGLFFEPYISGSIGVGFNRAYDFTITPTISEEVAAPPFTSNTTTTLIYTLGIGLQKSLNKQLQVAIGYEFANWGKVNLSPAVGQTTNQALTLNHLYAQELQLSLFYII